MGGMGLARLPRHISSAGTITNSQYAAFLNTSLAGRSNAHGIYNPGMGTAPQGGISQSSSEGGFTYSVKADMGDKPVNFVSWFDAARFVNWISNGGLSESSLETGAYELNDETSAGIVLVNPGSTWFLPSQDQWYKAAYYKGGGLDAGCWTYATQSDTEPAQVTADASGNRASGNFGNSANFNKGADWNGLDGNVTTVGTNGGPSAYGAFDMSGNVLEWNDAVSDEFAACAGGAGTKKAFGCRRTQRPRLIRRSRVSTWVFASPASPNRAPLRSSAS